MYDSCIKDIINNVTNQTTKYFIKGIFKTNLIYINEKCQRISSPYYFNNINEAEEKLNWFLYQNFFGKEFKLAKRKFKIHSRTESILTWNLLQTN